MVIDMGLDQVLGDKTDCPVMTLLAKRDINLIFASALEFGFFWGFFQILKQVTKQLM